MIILEIRIEIIYFNKSWSILYIKTRIKKVNIFLSIFNLIKTQKKVLHFVISILIITANKKNLEKVFFSYYQIHFQKNNNNIETLINFNSKENTITTTYILKLDI